MKQIRLLDWTPPSKTLYCSSPGKLGSIEMALGSHEPRHGIDRWQFRLARFVKTTSFLSAGLTFERKTMAHPHLEKTFNYIQHVVKELVLAILSLVIKF